MEVNQKLNRELAKTTVQEIKPEFQHGSVNEQAISDIMHSMMVINPSVEVYLLDPEGRILKYVAPKKVVQLEQVNLAPIKQFLNQTEHTTILGDDPRNPGEKKIFSAAEVIEDGALTGYVYIVLASQEYVSAAQMVLGSYIIGLSIRTIILILTVSLLVGMLAIWLITKKLTTIINGIRQFQAGDLKARIPTMNKDELDIIALAFNDMASAIEKNIADLKGIDELRKELISNVSHDLRTPIASIQGYAETLLLKDKTLGQAQKDEYLQIIYKSCEKLKAQVNELFELSKLESNQVKLQPEPFSIAELVHDVASKYRIISQKKGISINTVLSKDTPIVKADISLIDRVLQNLIDNAIRFCREGDFINLEIKMDRPGEVSVLIADSGAGIAREELQNIFERYYKGRQQNESTGLGLAIVKKIIDLHQSVIEVNSQPGKGTSFKFSLPVVQTA
jgi:signal transduction histidine kinase